jgi:hypothetical protein
MTSEIDRDEFISALRLRFPEVAASIDQDSGGLLHAEMGTFERCTVQAFLDDRLDKVQEYFAFAEELLASAGPELDNALHASYIEGFVLGGEDVRRARDIMPIKLRAEFDAARAQVGGVLIENTDSRSFLERFADWWRT